MQDALRGNLERPECMQQRAKFVPATEQCPPKPRGRKPKKTAEKESQDVGGRPSAAAAGFNTVGMSDQEVKDKVAKYHGTKNGQKEEIPEVVPTKKRARGKQNVEDGKVENTGNETCKEKRSKKAAAKAENEAGVSSKRTRKENAGDDASVPKKKKKTSAGDKEEATTRSKSKKTQKTEEEIQAEKKIAAKARVSRKSAAYHKAVKESKARGESKEEQVKAGKAATCRIFRSQSMYVSAAHARMSFTAYLYQGSV